MGNCVWVTCGVEWSPMVGQSTNILFLVLAVPSKGGYNGTLAELSRSQDPSYSHSPYHYIRFSYLRWKRARIWASSGLENSVTIVPNDHSISSHDASVWCCIAINFAKGSFWRSPSRSDSLGFWCYFGHTCLIVFLPNSPCRVQNSRGSKPQRKCLGRFSCSRRSKWTREGSRFIKPRMRMFSEENLSQPVDKICRCVIPGPRERGG